MNPKQCAMFSAVLAMVALPPAAVGQEGATVLSGAEVVNFTLGPDGKPTAKSQIKPLAYTGSKRHPKLPELPTMRELGYDMEFCISSWWFAPKGTPAEAGNGFANALEKATRTSRIQEFYEKKLFADVFLKGDALQKSLDDTWNRILPVAQQAKKK